MIGTGSLAERIAYRLRTHPWFDDPAYPNLHRPSAHANHNYDRRCAICNADVDRIAAVAVQVVGEHVTDQLTSIIHPTPETRGTR